MDASRPSRSPAVQNVLQQARGIISRNRHREGVGTRMFRRWKMPPPPTTHVAPTEAARHQSRPCGCHRCRPCGHRRRRRSRCHRSRPCRRSFQRQTSSPSGRATHMAPLLKPPMSPPPTPPKWFPPKPPVWAEVSQRTLAGFRGKRSRGGSRGRSGGEQPPTKTGPPNP